MDDILHVVAVVLGVGVACWGLPFGFGYLYSLFRSHAGLDSEKD